MNTTTFRIYMIKNHENQTKLADDMGIAQSALSYRINGKIEWRESEINFFRKRWKLSDQETVDIFFTEEVSISDTNEKGA